MSCDACVAGRPVCASAIRRLIACAVLALGAVPAIAAESVIQAVAGKPESTVVLAPAVKPVADSAAADSPPSAQTAESIAAILAEPDADLQQIEAQIDAGEFATSKVWLEARIATIEEASHRFDPDLVRPITLWATSSSVRVTLRQRWTIMAGLSTCSVSAQDWSLLIRSK
ncbi:MAG: hypothetical protein V3T18_09295 [Pseudomonadales bacterium]